MFHHFDVQLGTNNTELKKTRVRTPVRAIQFDNPAERWLLASLENDGSLGKLLLFGNDAVVSRYAHKAIL
jgi:hypothetical protein